VEIVGSIFSEDRKTVKYLQKSGDVVVETVYVNRPEKHIICFSSQVGCSMTCKFCVSGNRKFIRNLSSEELLLQCLNIIASRKIDFSKKILFSCMGEGEPFNNWKNVFPVLEEVTHLGYRVALSTVCNKPELISEFLKLRLPIKLQLSVHAVDQCKRNYMFGQFIPLSNIMYVLSGADPSNVELNFTLMQDVNDQCEDARKIFSTFGSKFYIKLNRYNQFTSSLRPSKEITTFQKILQDFGMAVEYYETDGLDIGAACGQLSSRKINGKLCFNMEETSKL